MEQVIITTFKLFENRLDILFILVFLTGCGFILYKLLSKGIVVITENLEAHFIKQSTVIEKIQEEVKQLKDLVIDIKVLDEKMDKMEDSLKDHELRIRALNEITIIHDTKIKSALDK